MKTREQILAPFLDEDGRLTCLPSKRQKRLLALEYVAERFESGRSYTEKEVNVLCTAWHSFCDFHLLRRELVEAGFLERERDGSRYWRAEAAEYCIT